MIRLWLAHLLRERASSESLRMQERGARMAGDSADAEYFARRAAEAEARELRERWRQVVR